MKTLVEIYTDGACSVQLANKPGGWGVYLNLPGVKERVLSGYVENTTNNQMELLAVIKAISVIKDNKKFSYKVYTDSQYVMYAINNRAEWERSNFKGKKNVEMVKELYALIDSFKYCKLEFIKVEGHSDNTGNTLADKLAVEAKESGRGKDESYTFQR